MFTDVLRTSACCVSCLRGDQQSGQYDHAKHKWHLALRYRHFSLPQSSSASSFTAGASEFFILSQSGEWLEPLRENLHARDSLETCYPRRRCVAKEESMGRILASLALGVSLLVAVSSEASAWVCFATGLGSRGWGRGHAMLDAEHSALRPREPDPPFP